MNCGPDILGWTFPALPGTRLRLHWSWPVVAAFAVFALPEAVALGHALLLVFTWLAGAALKAEAEYRLARDAGPIRLWPGGSLGWPGQTLPLGGELRIMAGGNGVLLLLLGLGVLGSLDPVLEAAVVLLAANWCLPVYPADLARLIAAVGQRHLSRKAAALVAAGVSAAMGAVILFLPQVLPGLAQMEYRFQPFGGIICAWCVLNAAWLLTAAEQGSLEQHPQFARQRRLRLVEDAGRRCPGCRRQLPPSARMCGYCERVV